MKSPKKPIKTKDYTEEDELFFVRLQRLKSVFQVKTDAELARHMGFTQQAIAAAKRKRKIPKTWLQKLAGMGISPNFVMDGEGKQVRLFPAPDDPKWVPDLEQSIGMEVAVARKIVEIAKIRYLKNWLPDRENMLAMHVNKVILPDIIRLVVDYDEEFEKLIEKK